MSLQVLQLSEIESVALDWLWEPYLARGKVTLLEGVAGSGKSFLAIDLMARLSQGGPMPDGRVLNHRVRSLLVNFEDDLATVIRPRLDAAGADVAGIYSYGGLQDRPNTLGDELGSLEDTIRQDGIELLVIDSLATVQPGTVTARNEGRVRRALADLTALAARTNVAILIVRQVERVSDGPSIVGRMGPVAVSLVLKSGDDGERAVVLARSILGSLEAERTVRLVPVGSSVKVEWPALAERALERPNLLPFPEAPRSGALEEAKVWLKSALARGPMWVRELLEAGKLLGFSRRTLERAKEELRFPGDYVPLGQSQRRYYWLDPSVPWSEPSDGIGKG